MVQGEVSGRETQERLVDEKHVWEHYQQPDVAQRLLEMILPSKPRSNEQKYRLGDKAHAVVVVRTRSD